MLVLSQNGYGHLIPGMFGGDPLRTLLVTAFACIKGAGCATDEHTSVESRSYESSYIKSDDC